MLIISVQTSSRYFIQLSCHLLTKIFHLIGRFRVVWYLFLDKRRNKALFLSLELRVANEKAVQAISLLGFQRIKLDLFSHGIEYRIKM